MPRRRSDPPETRAAVLADLRRALHAAVTVAGACARLLVLLSAGAARRSRWHQSLGECLARVFESLGGGYLKIGQLLGTRADLLPPALLAPLQRLHDRARPFPAVEARRILEESIGKPVERVFSTFDPVPVSSASIAQVHRAVLRESGREVAIKIKRPGVETAIDSDARLVTAAASLLSMWPPFRRLPLIDASAEVCRALRAQTDFGQEARNHRQFQILFADVEGVRVPQLLEDLCGRDVLVMEYLPGLRRLSDPTLPSEVARRATLAGLRALYRMIFGAGLIHGDLHPANVLVSREGPVVILDFGFVAAMAGPDRVAFAEFFLSIAVGDGQTAAANVCRTARGVPPDLDRGTFAQEIGALIAEAAGRTAGEFLVARFVGRLFAIQRRHQVRGTPSFTMAILSLMVFEGIIRARYPDLDFQREAVPHVLAALEGSDGEARGVDDSRIMEPRLR